MSGIDGRERAVTGMPPPRFQKWGRRVAVGLICFHACLWPWELYRRIRQVLRADLLVSSDVLTPGSTISIDVVTSGEIRNRIVLELVQETRRETLLEFHGELNRMNVYDVRTYRYTPRVILTPGMLAGFQPGPAVVMLTGHGGMKLLRTPSPVVRQQPVMLVAEPPPIGLGRALLLPGAPSTFPKVGPPEMEVNGDCFWERPSQAGATLTPDDLRTEEVAR